MRVSELIEELKQLPLNVTVYIDDGEYGLYMIHTVKYDERYGIILQ